MEWTQSLRSAIEYIETHLLEPVNIEGTAKAAYISVLYLKKAFKVMTGYSVEEYVRFRRLYLAALDVIAGREKVIDLSLKYGYETPESFSKAFIEKYSWNGFRETRSMRLQWVAILNGILKEITGSRTMRVKFGFLLKE